MPVRSPLLRKTTLIATFALTLALAAAMSAGSLDASAANQTAEAPRNLAEAFDTALAGKFETAAVALKTAPTTPENKPVAEAALKLLQQQLARAKRLGRERTDQTADAVERVKRAMLAQSWLPALKKKGIDRKLRALAGKVVSAYEGMPKAEDVADGDAAAAEAMRGRSLKALKGMPELVDKLQAPIAGNQTEYGKKLAALTVTLRKRLNEFQSAWTKADLETPAGRGAATTTLREMQTDLALSIVDVDSMVMAKPWRVALAQAQLAKSLAGDDHSYTKQDWYRQLLPETEALAARCVQEARWHDALTAYASLEELVKGRDAKEEERFGHQAKLARRHVRILRLYGDEDGDDEEDDDPADQPPDKKPSSRPRDARVTWEDMIVGIDAGMVKGAIDRLNDYYVTPVSYRKVIRGGLLSVKVLAETPQAARSFKGLKDDALRKTFIEAVDKQLRLAETRDRLDHVDLKLALDSVLRASDRTVKIDLGVLSMEFTDGMLDELDRFSSMIWPYDVSDFRKQTMGEFFGVGIQITKEPGKPLKVVTPLADTPGFRAGIKSGDSILKVNGRRTDDLTIDKLVRLITGKKGTKVVLTISRPGLLKPIDIPIVRAEIHIRTVKGWRRKPAGGWDHWLDREAGIGYIRLSQFTDTTRDDLVKAVKKLRSEGLESLIVDVRFNPGGLLRAATQVADEFLNTGQIVSTKGRQVRQTAVTAAKTGQFLEGDVAILVNEHSASASEIVSGALKDHDRAIIVGRRTFGKGSVQNVIPLRNRRAFLKLTTAYYYLPLGRRLHRENGSTDWGVSPDVAVNMTPRQMKRWQDIRRKTDLLKDVDQDQLAESLRRQYEADCQLNSTVVLLKLRQLKRSLKATPAKRLAGRQPTTAPAK